MKSPTTRNRTWAERQVGDSATIERTCTSQDPILFAHVSGNTCALALPYDYWRRQGRAFDGGDRSALAAQ